MAAVGAWNMRPKDFWRLHPTEFWWLAEAKRMPQRYGSLSEDDAAHLYEMMGYDKDD